MNNRIKMLLEERNDIITRMCDSLLEQNQNQLSSANGIEMKIAKNFVFNQLQKNKTDDISPIFFLMIQQKYMSLIKSLSVTRKR